MALRIAQQSLCDILFWGTKQWGIKKSNSTTAYTWTAFPVSNPNKTFAVLATSLTNSNTYGAEYYYGISLVELNGAFIAEDYCDVCYFVIGF